MTDPTRWSQPARTRITIDGRTYESADALPPEARRRYERAMSALADRDGNGVPDVVEGASPDPNLISQMTTSQRILVNGREYSSWDDVPRDLRAMMARGLQPEASSRLSFHLNPAALLALLLAAGLLGAAILWLAMG